MNITFPRHRHDLLFPMAKAVYKVPHMTLPELSYLSTRYYECENSTVTEEDFEEFQGTLTSLKPISDDLFSKMMGATRSVLKALHTFIDEFDIEKVYEGKQEEFHRSDPGYCEDLNGRRVNLLDYIEYFSKEVELNEILKNQLAGILNDSSTIVPFCCRTPHKEFNHMLHSSWTSLYRNCYYISTSAEKVLQQIVETATFGKCSHISKVDQSISSVLLYDTKGINITYKWIGTSYTRDNYINSNGTLFDGEYLRDSKVMLEIEAFRMFRMSQGRNQDESEKELAKFEDINYLQKALLTIKRQMKSAQSLSPKTKSKLRTLKNCLSTYMETLEERD